MNRTADRKEYRREGGEGLPGTQGKEGVEGPSPTVYPTVAGGLPQGRFHKVNTEELAVLEACTPRLKAPGCLQHFAGGGWLATAAQEQ